MWKQSSTVSHQMLHQLFTKRQFAVGTSKQRREQTSEEANGFGPLIRITPKGIYISNDKIGSLSICTYYFDENLNALSYIFCRNFKYFKIITYIARQQRKFYSICESSDLVLEMLFHVAFKCYGIASQKFLVKF